MDIPEIKEILENNCGDDLVLIDVIRQFFNIEISRDSKYNDRYDELINKYYDKR